MSVKGRNRAERGESKAAQCSGGYKRVQKGAGGARGRKGVQAEAGWQRALERVGCREQKRAKESMMKAARELRVTMEVDGDCGVHVTCVVCGQEFTRDSGAGLEVSELGPLMGDREIVGQICPDCLAAGVAGVEERVSWHVKELRAQATELKALAKRLAATDWPSVEQWEAFRAGAAGMACVRRNSIPF